MMLGTGMEEEVGAFLSMARVLPAMEIPPTAASTSGRALVVVDAISMIRVKVLLTLRAHRVWC